MKNLPQKVRSRKLSSRVDLTAMVSVSFLLIIFFMVVGELSKPKVMEYDLGYRRSCGPEQECNKPDENRTLTILLDDHDKMITYRGLLFSPIQMPKEVQYGKDGIRRELININEIVHQYSAALGRNQGVTVIIKPSKKSNYGNLVDILDEINITGINSYAIVDYYTPEETKLLASN
ncbi:ExbD/TolR family protein [Flavobacterium hungaricum]|uniref:Biopolymer transporter ExbD n=1 Tax=Flavobacterium hungaricum TaxID=2082725 RepID=A0ABR9TIG4_9FLAO|nr:biopolymer transporter ExbD [Flavobacterium hungaricum]MBE8724819.1 biopolymer transporter ExbD [Flavobacterium hungaricum]